MITKFSALYVGQIELDNVGLHGTPADERRYPNERLVEAFQTAKELSHTWLKKPPAGLPSLGWRENTPGGYTPTR